MAETPLAQQPPLDASAPSREKKSILSRRGFLQTAAAGLVGLAGASAARADDKVELEYETGGPLQSPPEMGFIADRRERAFNLRMSCATRHYDAAFPQHHGNGDEDLHGGQHSYSKALPKLADGTPDLAAYAIFRDAVVSGSYEAMENIVTAGPVRQKSPLGALTFRLDGADSSQFEVEPPPNFTSAWEAAEEVEMYWRALTRDVPYTEFATHPLVAEAVADLNSMSDYRGPREDGVVTPQVIFRGFQPGALKGPFLSQFLLKPYYFGNAPISQRFETAIAGEDFMTSWAEYMAIQNGANPTRHLTFDPVNRYLRNGRDLGEWLHRDFSFQGPQVACLMLLGWGEATWDPGNPTVHSVKQCGFTTLGGPDALDLVSRASRAALNAAWFQKWQVHRRLRPEEFGGRVHATKTGLANFQIHPDVLASQALQRIWDKHQSYLLPQAFPEGCPPHPAFPGGHSTFASAGVTMLKAYFKEDYVIPNPVVPNEDGTALVPWEGEPLTVGDELDKLASNIAHGRDGAGVHWRSDCEQGMKLGEKVVIEILKDLIECYAEPVYFSLRKYDGTQIEIKKA